MAGLVRILDLPEDYRDSRGQFVGNRAYIMLADDMLSTVAVEEPRLDSTVAVERPRPASTVAVERPRPTSTVAVEEPRSDAAVAIELPRASPTVAVERPHRGTSSATKKEEKQEEQKKEEIAAVVFSSFARIAGHDAAYQPTTKDRRLLKQLLDEGYTRDQIISGVQVAIAQHRQRQPGGQVRRFAFCVPAIRESGQPVRAIASAPRLDSITSEAVPAVTEKKLPHPAPSEAVPTVTEGTDDDAQKDVLATVAQWYAGEIGALTPMTRDTLRQLTTRYPDLDRWRDAFQASVGIPTPLGRWRYVQTVVANAGRTGAAESHSPDRQGETSGSKPPADDRPTEREEKPPSPTLPEEIQAGLDRLGWAGPCDEVAAQYQADPQRVEAWLDHWLERDRPGFNAAGAFLKSLRSGQSPPQKRQPFYAMDSGYPQGCSILSNSRVV